MKGAKLAKIIARTEVVRTIDTLCRQWQKPLAVLDVDGGIVFGREPEPDGFVYPVEVNGVRYGQVIGPEENAAAVATILSYTVRTELEKKALARETLEKYKEITLLYDIAEKITVTLDLEEVGALVIDTALKLVPADNASIMLLNNDSGLLEIIAAHGQEYSPKTSLRLGQGVAGMMAESGRTEIINDVRSDPRFVPGSVSIHSLICAALKTKDRVIGVLNLSTNKPFEYTSQHLKLVKMLASEAATAISNARLLEELRETFSGTIAVLAETIEKVDPANEGHSQRVANLSLLIGREMGLSKQALIQLRLAAVLHDIGKIGSNPGIRDEKMRIIRHTLYGANILQHLRQLREVVPGVKYHHEEYDGNGVPEGLKGSDIPQIARIIAVANYYDHLTSGYGGREKIPEEQALDAVQQHSGTRFDPEIVRAFIKTQKKMKMFSNLFYGR